jgi:putative flavoprotein involved in K+ transport
MGASQKSVDVDAIVIGGGQAGLSVGHHLAKRGVSFVILDAHKRIGDAWRKRWDSLRLFSPNRFNGLDGMPFPQGGHRFATKDEMADYLEAYARRFDLPVITDARVDSLTREGNRYIVRAGERRFEADHVVVAMSNFQEPRVPAFAKELASDIVQLPSLAYQQPSQLREGGVLVVGTGNSGAEIALEVARSHRTWLSGRDVGELPFRIEGLTARVLVPLIFRIMFHRVMTIRTPIGRKVRTRFLSHGGPRIRTKRADLLATGVELVPRVAGVREGRPVLEDGRIIDTSNVIWCTGFTPGFSWIHLPVLDESGPRHEAGVVPDEPGLYFVGLMFVYAASSVMVHGVGRDAERIAGIIARRCRRSRATGRSTVAEGATPTHSLQKLQVPSTKRTT